MTVPPQLRKVTVRELRAALERDGFILDRQRGSHRVYYRARDKRRVVIPYHRAPGLPSPSGPFPPSSGISVGPRMTCVDWA